MSCQGDMQLPLLLSAWRGHRLMVRDPSFAPFWKSVAPVYLFYPPTPAFAKAGAAPGTTAGVEPVLKSPFASMAPSYTPRHLFFTAFKPAVCPPALKCPRMPCQGSSPSYRPQPSVFHGVQACRLPAIKCFRGLAKATLPATGPSLAKATLAATGPSHLFLRAFKAAVCPRPNASAGLAKATQAPAICFEGRSRLPFARPQMLLQALPWQLQAPAICF